MMRKTLGAVSILALVAGLAASTHGPHGSIGSKVASMLTMVSPASAVERQAAAINGSTNNYAIIAPTFNGTEAVGGGPESYIRLFNGAGATGSSTTYSIKVVGVPSGLTYGPGTTVQIAHLASVQYSLGEILGLAGAGALTGGDTGYAIYLQDADPEAGYQHVVYDWTTNLFENMSNCGSLLNEQMVSLHNEMVLANLHTTAGGPAATFPSSIVIYNYYNVPITYTLTVFNAGYRTNGVMSPNSGKLTCQITGNTVQPNSSLTIPESTIEAHAGCTLDSDEHYMDVVIADASGGQPNAVLSHLIRITGLQNNTVNLTDVCAVNKISASTSTGGGTFTPPPSIYQ